MENFFDEIEEPQDGMEILDAGKLEEVEEELEKEEPISVYVKTNEEGYVTDVNSDVFIKDFEGWQKIAEGYGDKFAHAQSQYFDKPLVSDDGKFNFKLEEIKK